MKQRIFDLADPNDLEVLKDPDMNLLEQICALMKVSTPLFDLVKSSEGKFQDALIDALLSTYSSRFNTKLLYVEVLDEEGEVVFTNPHPYYAVNPLTVEQWFDLITEYMDMDCKDLFKFVEKSKETTSYNVTYGSMLYEFTAIKNAGLVFYHYNSESSTSVRLYVKVGDMIYYMPYKVFGKSSGRYNRATNHNYPESIKLMILSLRNIDMDDLASKVAIIVGGIEERKSKNLSMEEVLNLLGTCRENTPSELMDYCSSMYTEESDKMSDQLWRLTYLDKTLGEVLESFTDPVKSTDTRTYLGQLAYDTLVCDRLYRED